MQSKNSKQKQNASFGNITTLTTDLTAAMIIFFIPGFFMNSILFSNSRQHRSTSLQNCPATFLWRGGFSQIDDSLKAYLR